MTSYVADAAARDRVREQDEPQVVRDSRELAVLRMAVGTVDLEQ